VVYFQIISYISLFSFVLESFSTIKPLSVLYPKQQMT